MPKYTAKDWDDVRRKFRNSIMADTSLHSLAQSLDTADWPVPGEEEKPSKYIDFTYDELLMLPEIAGKVDRAEHLVGILKETLAFDDPFGDMVAQVEESSARENPILKTLARLGIPEAYPLQLVNLSEGTRTVCESEGVKTLGEFANLAQQMSTRVVIGGDFRAMLNALSHGDETGIGQFLPFRRGESGLHLAEAIGLVVAGLSRADQVALATALGAKLPADQAAVVKPLDAAARDSLLRQLRLRTDAMCQWFKDQQARLREQVSAGTTVERYLVVLNDPVREAVGAHLLRGVLGLATEDSAPASAERKGGFFSRLFGRG